VIHFLITEIVIYVVPIMKGTVMTIKSTCCSLVSSI
jgi:hypothetical protein